jgi:hypothetical protein
MDIVKNEIALGTGKGDFFVPDEVYENIDLNLKG